ncbi:peroxidase 19-like [Zingiber officinale]|uniref:peroxidase 19-like n=1 Tax=Zingiber officinale TaxID=94328 RepID=UPI001C4D29DB|nr:peroxidase 19-like [Zingiber officinale]
MEGSRGRLGRDGRRSHFYSFLVLSCLVACSTCGFAEGSEAGSNVTGGVRNAAKGKGKRRAAPIRHQLSLDFYTHNCPQLDRIVASVTAQRFRERPATGAAVIRLFFHDCFVEGCDASVLIAPSAGGGRAMAGPAVERDVEENRSLPEEAFETIEMAKAAVERQCPGVVTCADILAVAARDFVHLAGGPNYAVKKGRKDSRVSLAAKVSPNLSRANSTVDDLLRLFAGKGLSAVDLVALSGAHTIGFSHCDQFVGRLYDFRGSATGGDPSLDPRLLKALRMSCPRAGGNGDVVAPFDVRTPFDFDHMYYGNLEAGMGLLATDQALYSDSRTRPVVQELGRDKARFFEAFAGGMDKMGSIRVKKGKTGEIRKVCSKHLSSH